MKNTGNRLKLNGKPAAKNIKFVKYLLTPEFNKSHSRKEAPPCKGEIINTDLTICLLFQD